MTRYADAQLTALKKALLEAGETHKSPASTVLTRYAIERFLRRLGEVESGSKRELVLRGGVLLTYRHPEDARPSTMLDLLCRRVMDDAALQAWLQSVCAVADPDDGLQFQTDSILLTDKRTPAGYRSREATLGVLLGRQRTQLHVNIAYQKDLLPHPQEETLTPLLSLPMTPPKVYTCIKETVLAEKLHMVHGLGRRPSYKDMYDMFLLVQLHAHGGGPLMAAIKTTFDSNISTITGNLPHALAPALADDPVQNAGWGAFARQMGNPARAVSWGDTVRRLHDFFTPPWDHLNRQKPFAATWKPSDGWV